MVLVLSINGDEWRVIPGYSVCNPGQCMVGEKNKEMYDIVDLDED
jgi:hypothetical protein